MGLFDKVKNLFTEEVEEEKPIKKEVRQVEVSIPKKEEIIDDIPKPEVKEEKQFFFDDKDFEDLKVVERRPIAKEEPKREEKLPYKGSAISVKQVEKKEFKPSPIISPVYGVLDKNYSKEDINPKPSNRTYYKDRSKITVDDVRNRAFSTIEDDLKNEILEDDYLSDLREQVEDDLNLFSEDENVEIVNNDEIDGIEFENGRTIKRGKKIFDDEFDDDTKYLSRKIKEQQKRLNELNDIINEENETTKIEIKVEVPKNKKVRVTKSLDDVLSIVEKDTPLGALEDKIDNQNFEDENKIEEDIQTFEEEENIEIIEENNQIDQAFTDAMDDIDIAIASENANDKLEDELEENLYDKVDSQENLYEDIDSKEEIDNEEEKAETKKTKIKKEKTKEKSKEKDLSDSELFDLIDTMYDKKDDE